MKKNHNLLISYRFKPGIYFKVLNIVVHFGAYFILLCGFILMIINNFKDAAAGIFFILIIIYLFIRKCNMVKKIDLYDDNILVITTNKKDFLISTSDIKYIEWMRGDFVLLIRKKILYFNVPIIDDDFISIIEKIRDNHITKIGIFLKSDLK